MCRSGSSLVRETGSGNLGSLPKVVSYDLGALAATRPVGGMSAVSTLELLRIFKGATCKK